MASPYGHVLKLKRAAEHMKGLKAEIKSWVETENQAYTRIQPDPDRPGDLLVYASVESLPPVDPISLLVGDIVYNMRSALDHLAYSLTEAYTQPVPEEVAEDSQFPIIGKKPLKGISGRTMFQLQMHRIRGMDPRAQAVVEGLQPYQDVHWHMNPLWLLNGIASMDKRSLLNFSVTTLDKVAFKSVEDQGMNATTLIEYVPAVVERNTVVGRIPAGAFHSDSDVDVNIKPALNISFADGPFRMFPIEVTLRSIYWHLLRRVFIPLEPFLGISSTS